MPGSRSSAAMKVSRFLPSLRDWGNAVAAVPALFVGLAVMESAKARNTANGSEDYFVAFAVAMMVYAAQILVWTAVRRRVRGARNRDQRSNDR